VAHFPVIGDSETARKKAMTRKLKKGRRIGRNPKTGSEVANSPRRVIVFTPSAILKQRINGHSRGGVGE
jgi:nucleoid DNA-binding protein